MEPFRYHIYICTQRKPDGVPSCPNAGALEILDILKQELTQAGLSNDVQVTPCGCLGICGRGPNMVVYPDGVWYGGLTPGGISTIIQEHMINNRPAEEWLIQNPEALKNEIIAHDQMAAEMKTIMDKAGVIPEELNQYMRSFMESRLVLTALELDVFTAIGKGAAAVDIAKTCGTDPRATEALLNALVAIQVLDKDKKTFMNRPLTARYLVEGAEHDSRIAAMHIAGLWHRWSTLTESVQKGTSVVVMRGVERDENETKSFIAAMHKNAVFRAEKIAEMLDLDSVSKMLDLGGGSGAYAIAFTKHNPSVKTTVFDLPAVIPLTKKYVTDEGLENNIQFIEGNMLNDSWGEGYDLIWISAICHMFGPDENLALFKKAHKALNPNGRIFIQDFILSDDKTSPRFGAVFALNMLVNTQAGSSYSKAEYVEWLSSAGFNDIKRNPLPGPTDLITAVKR